MDHPQDQQHQLETQSLNPVPNRRAINDLHFNALNTNYKNANAKLNNNNNNTSSSSSGQAQVIQGEDSKVLLLPSNHRKFIIVPAQPGSAIGGSTSPTSGGSTSPNQQPSGSTSSGTTPPSGIPVAKFEIGESSASGTSSGYPLATAASKPKQFHSLRSVRSANDRSGIADAHLNPAIVRTGSYIFSDSGGTPRLFSDATSIRSLASIGVGSTDGRRMVIRRVPNSPTELLTIINPPTC